MPGTQHRLEIASACRPSDPPAQTERAAVPVLMALPRSMSRCLRDPDGRRPGTVHHHQLPGPQVARRLRPLQPARRNLALDCGKALTKPHRAPRRSEWGGRLPELVNRYWNAATSRGRASRDPAKAGLSRDCPSRAGPFAWCFSNRSLGAGRLSDFRGDRRQQPFSFSFGCPQQRGAKHREDLLIAPGGNARSNCSFHDGAPVQSPAPVWQAIQEQ
jgi:hypothetical protein